MWCIGGRRVLVLVAALATPTGWLAVTRTVVHRGLGTPNWEKASENHTNKQYTHHKITIKHLVFMIKMLLVAVHYKMHSKPSRATIGHNRMTRQPSCLQCKQADRDCVSRSRLSVAALSMCHMPSCDCWCCIISLPQLQGG